MDKGKKRERNVNFTRDETEKLISLVEGKKHIIENKKSDAVTWQDKEKAWKAIEAEFNSSGGGVFRDAKHLKLKYEALKRDTRKKSSVIRAERYKTGGGTNEASPLTPTEQKIKDMILLSVEGGESLYDSDQIEVVTEEPETVEAINPTLDLEEPLSLSDADAAADYEPSRKKICLSIPQDDAMPSTSQSDGIPETPRSKWTDWRPASLKAKKHPALCQPKEKRPFEKLAEAKLDIAALQKKIIEEELEEKALKKQILKEELEHKRDMYFLEKQEMNLKIDILKADLENKKKIILSYFFYFFHKNEPSHLYSLKG